MSNEYDRIPIDEVIKREQEEHGHFFDDGAKRFFRSRWDDTAYYQFGFYYWITSEKFDDNTPRKYTIRFACKSCMSIHDINGFQAFNTKREAVARLKWYLTHDDKPELTNYHHWKMELQHVPCDGEPTPEA